MQEFDIAKLLNKVGSMYKLVVLTSLRAVELGDGAANLTGNKHEKKVINAALDEILEGKIEYKVKEKK
ncbi:MAG: DNA-directed RNA polymerase subunit omega [Candidatus Omnitrophica bacterium]|nr:DNA-directed RNA polymerase subunit omega [Candidatus Omnitrophota bacterium]MDD5436181.1 DNA-directed RNA polymerase subunit omega [Candidatus Omnitrophota bacterium]